MASQMALIVYLIVAVALFKGATAATYFVGDEIGWAIPPGGSADYSTWASNRTFKIGDSIVFNWTGKHTVAEVPYAIYDSCNSTNFIGPIQDTSPVEVTLDSNGTRYFICTLDTHCQDCQKVAINIGEGNSASSLIVRTLYATVSTIVIVLLSYYI